MEIKYKDDNKERSNSHEFYISEIFDFYNSYNNITGSIEIVGYGRDKNEAIEEVISQFEVVKNKLKALIDELEKFKLEYEE